MRGKARGPGWAARGRIGVFFCLIADRCGGFGLVEVGGKVVGKGEGLLVWLVTV